MKLLLSSYGVANNSIAKALDKLTGISRSKVRIGFIPTAANVEPGNKDWFVSQISNLHKYGFNWIDIIDISAHDINWKERLSRCGVIFVSGGNTFHLLNEVRKTKFDNWLRQNLSKKVYVGSSAGSILLTPTIAIAAVEPGDVNYPGIKDLKGLNLVDFEISPHTPEQLSYEANKKYAERTKNKLYALDDNSAILLTDEELKIISEGKWKLY